MKSNVEKIYNDLFERYPTLSCVKEEVEAVFEIIKETYIKKGKLLVCGNGGSASDSTHIVGELMKGFMLSRQLPESEKARFQNKEIADGLQGALPAISLVGEAALMTAFCNDCSPDMVFAQQVYGLMNENDTLLCLSTSGDSKNVVAAAETARVKGGRVVSIVGEKGGKLFELSDATIKLPSPITPTIQEYTLPVYHTICAMLESEFFGE